MTPREKELEAELRRIRKRLPRCGGRTKHGYRCAQGVGHDGPHSHPNEQLHG